MDVDSARLSLEYMSIRALLRWPTNPKAHNQPGIAASIRKRGFNDPFVIDERTGQLVEGHGRLDALEALKTAGRPAPKHVVVNGDDWLVPVVRGVSFESDDEAEEYIVAHNQMTIGGGWANDRLAPILERAAARKVPVGMMGFAQDHVAAIIAAARARAAGPPVDPAGGGAGGAGITGSDPGPGRYRSQYGVIVICSDEAEQRRIFQQLQAAGHTCRIVVT